MGHDRSDPEAVEREVLRSWGKDWDPPVELREHTRAALRERGLLGTGPASSRRVAFAWSSVAAAAAALAFVVGLGLGRRPAAEQPAVPTGERYILLLYENDAYRAPATPEAHRERVREYESWARATAGAGRFVDGNELSSDGRWCRPAEAGLEVATPPADPERGTLAGYFVIGASSYDDAIAVTRGCPHLRHGGTVEVRRIATSG